MGVNWWMTDRTARRLKRPMTALEKGFGRSGGDRLRRLNRGLSDRWLNCSAGRRAPARIEDPAEQRTRPNESLHAGISANSLSLAHLFDLVGSIPDGR